MVVRSGCFSVAAWSTETGIHEQVFTLVSVRNGVLDNPSLLPKQNPFDVFVCSWLLGASLLAERLMLKRESKVEDFEKLQRNKSSLSYEDQMEVLESQNAQNNPQPIVPANQLPRSPNSSDSAAIPSGTADHKKLKPKP
eukprot:447241-Amphidinium_carterae.2